MKYVYATTGKVLLMSVTSAAGAALLSSSVFNFLINIREYY